MGKKEEIGTVLDIIVSPKSSRSLITIDKNNQVKVFLNSPPVDGKANKECIQLFSKTFNIPKSSITIEKGEKGKRKRIVLIGKTEVEIMEILNEK